MTLKISLAGLDRNGKATIFKTLEVKNISEALTEKRRLLKEKGVVTVKLEFLRTLKGGKK